jgi:hypothetical protein
VSPCCHWIDGRSWARGTPWGRCTWPTTSASTPPSTSYKVPPWIAQIGTVPRPHRYAPPRPFSSRSLPWTGWKADYPTEASFIAPACLIAKVEHATHIPSTPRPDPPPLPLMSWLTYSSRCVSSRLVSPLPACLPACRGSGASRPPGPQVWQGLLHVEWRQGRRARVTDVTRFEDVLYCWYILKRLHAKR